MVDEGSDVHIVLLRVLRISGLDDDTVFIVTWRFSLIDEYMGFIDIEVIDEVVARDSLPPGTTGVALVSSGIIVIKENSDNDNNNERYDIQMENV